MKVSAIAASAMLMPPEAEPVMPASTVTVIASLTSGLGIARSALATTQEARQARRSRRRSRTPTRCSSPPAMAPPIAGLAALGEAPLTPASRRTQHGEDADQQRAFDRPDRRELGDFLHHRAWRRRSRPARIHGCSPYSCGISVVNNLLHHADQHQRQDRDQRIGQLVPGEWPRLVEQVGAIAFAGGQRLRAGATPGSSCPRPG